MGDPKRPHSKEIVMRYITTIGLLLIVVLVQPVSAEFYRYKDPQGNVIYTDDLNKVPLDQRETVKSYKESVYQPPKAPKREQEPKEIDPTDTEDKEYQVLRGQEKMLTQERNALTQEMDRLNQERQKAVTQQQIKAYNRRIVDFNARIQAYEEKQKVFTAEVEKYNAKKKAQEKARQNEQ
jgi:DNA repair exonuclease SbcCD ATPase subunit